MRRRVGLRLPMPDSGADHGFVERVPTFGASHARRSYVLFSVAQRAGANFGSLSGSAVRIARSTQPGKNRSSGSSHSRTEARHESPVRPLTKRITSWINPSFLSPFRMRIPSHTGMLRTSADSSFASASRAGRCTSCRDICVPSVGQTNWSG